MTIDPKLLDQAVAAVTQKQPESNVDNAIDYDALDDAVRRVQDPLYQSIISQEPQPQPKQQQSPIRLQPPAADKYIQGVDYNAVQKKALKRGKDAAHLFGRTATTDTAGGTSALVGSMLLPLTDEGKKMQNYFSAEQLISRHGYTPESLNTAESVSQIISQLEGKKRDIHKTMRQSYGMGITLAPEQDGTYQEINRHISSLERIRTGLEQGKTTSDIISEGKSLWENPDQLSSAPGKMYNWGREQIQKTQDLFPRTGKFSDDWHLEIAQSLGQIPLLMASIVAAPFSGGASVALSYAYLGQLAGQVGGQKVVEYNNYYRDKGYVPSDYERMALAFLDVAIEGVTERLRLGSIFRQLDPFVGKMIKRPILAASAGDRAVLGNIYDKYIKHATKEQQSALLKLAKGVGRNIAEEAPEEFTAEFLQSLTDRLYQDKEDWGTIGDAISAGFAGARGAVVMGTFIGGAQNWSQNKMLDQRRRSAGSLILGVEKETGNTFEVIGRDEKGDYITINPEGTVKTVKPDQAEEIIPVSYDTYKEVMRQMPSAQQEIIQFSDRMIEDEATIKSADFVDSFANKQTGNVHILADQDGKPVMYATSGDPTKPIGFDSETGRDNIILVKSEDNPGQEYIYDPRLFPNLKFLSPVQQEDYESDMYERIKAMRSEQVMGETQQDNQRKAVEGELRPFEMGEIVRKGDQQGEIVWISDDGNEFRMRVDQGDGKERVVSVPVDQYHKIVRGIGSIAEDLNMPDPGEFQLGESVVYDDFEGTVVETTPEGITVQYAGEQDTTFIPVTELGQVERLDQQQDAQESVQEQQQETTEQTPSETATEAPQTWQIGKKSYTIQKQEDGTTFIPFEDGKDDTKTIKSQINTDTYDVEPVIETRPIEGVPEFAKVKTEDVVLGVTIKPKSNAKAAENEKPATQVEVDTAVQSQDQAPQGQEDQAGVPEGIGQDRGDRAETAPAVLAETAEQERDKSITHIKTARDAAKDLIKKYVKRGDTYDHLKNSFLGSHSDKYGAAIGMHVNGKAQTNKIVVISLHGQDLSKPEVFSLKELYDEIKKENQESPKQEPATPKAAIKQAPAVLETETPTPAKADLAEDVKSGEKGEVSDQPVVRVETEKQPEAKQSKDGDRVFNNKKTGIPHYDGVLNEGGGVGYHYWEKGLQGRVEYMSPDEYLQRVRDGFNKKRKGRPEPAQDTFMNAESQQKIKDGIQRGEKIDMPMLDYTAGDFSQEGRNRATVAKEMGVKKMPVFIIESVAREQKEQRAAEVVKEAIKNVSDVTADNVFKYITDKHGSRASDYIKWSLNDVWTPLIKAAKQSPAVATPKSKLEIKKTPKADNKSEQPKQEYRYRLELRPFDIGTTPDGGFARWENDGSKYGAVVYDRKLTRRERDNFNLNPVSEIQEWDGKTVRSRFAQEQYYNDVRVFENNSGRYMVELTVRDAEGKEIDKEVVNATTFLKDIESGEYTLHDKPAQEKKPEPKQPEVKRQVKTQASDKTARMTSKLGELSRGAKGAYASRVVETADQLPDAIKALPEFAANRENIQAVFHPENKTIYFVADNLNNEGDLVVAWIHEQGIHRGLRVLFAEDEAALRQAMLKVFNSVSIDEMSRVVSQGELDIYEKSKKTDADKARLGEEYLAYLSRKVATGQQLTGKQRSAWRKFVDSVMEAVARLFDGTGKTVSRKEIESLIHSAVSSLYKDNPVPRFVADHEKLSGVSPQSMFSIHEAPVQRERISRHLAKELKITGAKALEELDKYTSMLGDGYSAFITQVTRNKDSYPSMTTGDLPSNSDNSYRVTVDLVGACVRMLRAMAVHEYLKATGTKMSHIQIKALEVELNKAGFDLTCSYCYVFTHRDAAISKLEVMKDHLARGKIPQHVEHNIQKAKDEKERDKWIERKAMYNKAIREAKENPGWIDEFNKLPDILQIKTPADLGTLLGISKEAHEFLQRYPAIHALKQKEGDGGNMRMPSANIAMAGQIATLGDKVRADIMKWGGLRWQSNMDFIPMMAYDYVQGIVEMAMAKIPGHIYTKELDLALLIGNNGFKVNLSAAPLLREGNVQWETDKDGNRRPQLDTGIGSMRWDDIEKAMGAGPDHMGVMMLGSNDAVIDWATTEQTPYSHYVIPWHSSGMPAAISKVFTFGKDKRGKPGPVGAVNYTDPHEQVRVYDTKEQVPAKFRPIAVPHKNNKGVSLGRYVVDFTRLGEVDATLKPFADEYALQLEEWKKNKDNKGTMTGFNIPPSLFIDQARGASDADATRAYFNVIQGKMQDIILPLFESYRRRYQGRTGKHHGDYYWVLKKHYARTDTPFLPPDPSKINYDHAMKLDREWSNSDLSKAITEGGKTLMEAYRDKYMSPEDKAMIDVAAEKVLKSENPMKDALSVPKPRMSMKDSKPPESIRNKTVDQVVEESDITRLSRDYRQAVVDADTYYDQHLDNRDKSGYRGKFGMPAQEAAKYEEHLRQRVKEKKSAEGAKALSDKAEQLGREVDREYDKVKSLIDRVPPRNLSREDKLDKLLSHERQRMAKHFPKEVTVYRGGTNKSRSTYFPGVFVSKVQKDASQYGDVAQFDITAKLLEWDPSNYDARRLAYFMLNKGDAKEIKSPWALARDKVFEEYAMDMYMFPTEEMVKAVQMAGYDGIEFGNDIWLTDNIENYQVESVQKKLPETIKIDGKDRPTVNSEGRPIHPTEEGIRNFWKWFTPASALTDNQGRPLVMYHGTNTEGDYSSFMKGYLYITDSKEYANNFADIDLYNASVMPVYAAFHNTLDLTKLGLNKISVKDFVDYINTKTNTKLSKEDIAEITNKIENYKKQTGEDVLIWEYFRVAGEAIIDNLSFNGYDSVKLSETHPGTKSEIHNSYIAFFPTQIKSATGNEGTFDGENPDIRFQFADPTTGFYSPTERALGAVKQDKGTPEQMLQMLLKNGAKQAELDWMGWDEFVQGKRSVTKDEVQQWISENKVEVQEVVKGKLPDPITELPNDYEVKDRGENYVTSPGLDQFRYYVTDHNGRAISSGATRNQAIQNTINYLNKDPLTPTKFSEYQTPGGETYKEFLLTMPRQVKPELKGRDISKEPFPYLTPFVSSHYDEPNPIAHVRVNERTDTDGNKVLFLEEIQSDWAQKGRDEGWKPDVNKLQNTLNQKNKELIEQKEKLGYSDIRKQLSVFNKQMLDKYGTGWGAEGQSNLSIQETQALDNLTTKQKSINSDLQQTESDILSLEIQIENATGVPSMPFKQTPQWVNLALRRMVRYAAENGFDRIAWTTGEQQNNRYSLEKQIDRLDYSKNPNGTYYISGVRGGREVIHKDGLTEKELGSNVGKEVAQRIINDEGKRIGDAMHKSLQGEGLKVGGEGMKAFYDQIVPAQANKLGKKFGAKVEPVTIEADGETKVMSLPITDQMRESVMSEGVPMFQLIGKKGAQALDAAQEATTRMDNLSVAREMETAKKDPKAIRLATGWEMGADGKWRYEVDDNLPVMPISDIINLEAQNEVYTKEVPLSTVIKHDEVFKAYPQLKKYKTVFYNYGSDPALVSGGFVDSKKQVIGIGIVSQPGIKSVLESRYGDRPNIRGKVSIGIHDENSLKSNLLHEIQHLVQNIEGFGRGTAQGDVLQVLTKEKLKEFNEAGRYQKYSESDKYGIAENEVLRERGLDNTPPYIAKYDLYRRTAGEVESRNVQTRMDMTPEQRRETLLKDTEDVARKDQIFIMESISGQAMSQQPSPEKLAHHREVSDTINAIKGKSSVKTPVITVMQQDLLETLVNNNEPGYIINSVREALSEDTVRIMGFRTDRGVYIVTDNTLTTEAVSTWIHEVGVHEGIISLIPNKTDRQRLLERIYDSVGEEGVRNVIGNDMVYGMYEKLSKADRGEEYLAYLSHKMDGNELLTPQEQGIWQKIKNWIKTLLDRIYGNDIKLSDTQIRDIVRASVQTTLRHGNQRVPDLFDTVASQAQGLQAQGEQVTHGVMFQLKPKDGDGIVRVPGKPQWHKDPERTLEQLKGYIEEINSGNKTYYRSVQALRREVIEDFIRENRVALRVINPMKIPAALNRVNRAARTDKSLMAAIAYLEDIIRQGKVRQGKQRAVEFIKSLPEIKDSRNSFGTIKAQNMLQRGVNIKDAVLEFARMNEEQIEVLRKEYNDFIGGTQESLNDLSPALKKIATEQIEEAEFVHRLLDVFGNLKNKSPQEVDIAISYWNAQFEGFKEEFRENRRQYRERINEIQSDVYEEVSGSVDSQSALEDVVIPQKKREEGEGNIRWYESMMGSISSLSHSIWRGYKAGKKAMEYTASTLYKLLTGLERAASAKTVMLDGMISTIRGYVKDVYGSETIGARELDKEIKIPLMRQVIKNKDEYTETYVSVKIDTAAHMWASWQSEANRPYMDRMVLNNAKHYMTEAQFNQLNEMLPQEAKDLAMLLKNDYFGNKTYYDAVNNVLYRYTGRTLPRLLDYIPVAAEKVAPTIELDKDGFGIFRSITKKRVGGNYSIDRNGIYRAAIKYAEDVSSFSTLAEPITDMMQAINNHDVLRALHANKTHDRALRIIDLMNKGYNKEMNKDTRSIMKFHRRFTQSKILLNYNLLPKQFVSIITMLDYEFGDPVGIATEFMRYATGTMGKEHGRIVKDIVRNHPDLKFRNIIDIESLTQMGKRKIHIRMFGDSKADITKGMLAVALYNPTAVGDRIAIEWGGIPIASHVYKVEYQKAIDQTLSHIEAKQHASQKAADVLAEFIGQTQQSGKFTHTSAFQYGGFRVATAFMNSVMAYSRKTFKHARNIQRDFYAGYKRSTDQGDSDTVATFKALASLDPKKLGGLLLYTTVLPLMWETISTLGGNWARLFDDDEEEKKKAWWQMVFSATLGWTKGLLGLGFFLQYGFNYALGRRYGNQDDNLIPTFNDTFTMIDSSIKAMQVLSKYDSETIKEEPQYKQQLFNALSDAGISFLGFRYGAPMTAMNRVWQVATEKEYDTLLRSAARLYGLPKQELERLFDGSFYEKLPDKLEDYLGEVKADKNAAGKNINYGTEIKKYQAYKKHVKDKQHERDLTVLMGSKSNTEKATWVAKRYMDYPNVNAFIDGFVRKYTDRLDPVIYDGKSYWPTPVISDELSDHIYLQVAKKIRTEKIPDAQKIKKLDDLIYGAPRMSVSVSDQIKKMKP
jgi:hypothetical protein